METPDPKHDAPQPFNVSTFLDSLDSRPLRLKTAVKGALLLVVALFAGMLLAPDMLHPPEILTADHLGKPSPITLRAERSYLIRDDEGTLRQQRNAEALVLPVFDRLLFNASDQSAKLQAALKIVKDEQVAWLISYDQSFRGLENEQINDGPDNGKVPLDPSTLSYIQSKDTLQQELFSAQRNDMVLHLKAHKRKAFKQLVTHLTPLRDAFSKGLGVMISEADWEELLKTGLSDQWCSYAVSAHDSMAGKSMLSPQDHLILTQSDRIRVRIWKTRQGFTEEIWSAPYTDAVLAGDIGKALYAYSRSAGGKLSSAQLNLAQRLVSEVLQPGLVYNGAETARQQHDAVAAVRPLTFPVSKGDIILRTGETVTKHHLVIMSGIQQQRLRQPGWLKFISFGLFFLLLVVVVNTYGSRNIRKYDPRMRDYLFLAIIFLITLSLIKAAVWEGIAIAESLPRIPMTAYYYLMPIAAGTMIVRVVLNSESAYLFAVATAITAGLVFDNSLMTAAYILLTSLVAADGASPLHSRWTLLRAGLRTGLVGATVAFVASLNAGEALSIQTLILMGAGLLGGILSGLLTGVLVPLIEAFFDYTTDVKLLNLINLNHPILKELLVQAPGTHHHSMMVSRLAEQAAKNIRANPLLCRAGGLYHDIGKIKTPLYFSENVQDNTDYHRTLSPSMSVRILASHVSEGVEMAKRAGLGERLVSLIEQHHGTNIISQFLERAKQKANEEGLDPADVTGTAFRYPGPLPQSREAGILMMADSAESACRRLEHPTPDKIRNTASRVVYQLFRDGQLNESELTLSDLERIIDAFATQLTEVQGRQPVYLGNRPTTKDVKKVSSDDIGN